MKNNKLKKIICAALLCSTFAVPYMGSVEAAKAPDVKAEAQQTEKSQQEMQAKLTALEGKLKAVEADKTGETNTAAIKEITEELKELHKQMESSAVAQSRIMEALDDVQYKNQEMEKFMADPSDGYYGTAATEKYLVYPGGNGSTPSYTQDAINAQGNSTMIFAYAPNQLYKIYCRRGYLTDLAFHKGENIKFVGGGDTVGWTVTNSSVDGVPHLYIKPVVETSTTNLIVTTEKHSYQLILNTSDWYNPMVTWTYEAENMANGIMAQAKENRLTTGQVATTNIASLDFSYHVSGGESSSRPSMVFSDGEKTFIKFDKMVARKYPLFIKEKGSKDMKITNYKVKDNYFIVEKVFDRAQIRLSDSEIITIKHSK